MSSYSKALTEGILNEIVHQNSDPFPVTPAPSGWTDLGLASTPSEGLVYQKFVYNGNGRTILAYNYELEKVTYP